MMTFCPGGSKNDRPGVRAAGRLISKTKSVSTSGSKRGLLMHNRRSSCLIQPMLLLNRPPGRSWSGSTKTRGIKMTKKEYIPKRAMSIQAHPDDQEFSIAGTLARWAKAGCEIVCVVITSGDSGSNDPAHGAKYKKTLAKLREGEQSAANEVLGIQETVFLRYPDGELEPTLGLRRELTRLIRRCKPDVVVTGDPETFFYGSDYV